MAGYLSARLYKSKFQLSPSPPLHPFSPFYPVMGGLRWKRNILMTSLLVPGIVFGVFFFLNLLLWGAESSAAVPYTTILALLCLWFGISLPLTFLGAFFGFGCKISPSPSDEVKENFGDTMDPQTTPCCNKCSPVISSFLGGILPFLVS